MTTPTTNFGWLKPDATEKADIAVINAAMDEIDADLKTVADAKASKYPTIGSWSVQRKFSIAASNDWSPIRRTDGVELWREHYYEPGNVGAFTFTPQGYLKFTQNGVYRMYVNLTCFGMTSSTTSGDFGFSLFPIDGVDMSADIVDSTYHEIRSNTDDWFRLTSLTGIMYLSTSWNITLNQEYWLRVYHHTSAGAIGVSFDPKESGMFPMTFTLEGVKSL